MAPSDDTEFIQKLLNQTKPAEDEHAQRVKRYDDSYDVWRPSRASLKKQPAGLSKTRIPFAMATIDTALVNIAQGKPKCQVLPRSPQWADKAKSFELVMDYYTDRDHLAEKVPSYDQQALVYGVTVGKNHWLYKEGEKTVKGWEDDPYTGGPLPVVHTEKTVIHDGPSFEVWDVYDAWWDPNGRSVDACDYFVLRSWPGKQELLRNECGVPHDHGPEECTGIYHNVEKLLTLGSGRKKASSAQNRFLSNEKNLKKDAFELLEVWRDNRVTLIGNRQVVLRDSPNPHWHGRKPIIAASVRPDMFQIQGVPETELIDHIQQALWTVQNLRHENELLTVQRMFTYREGGIIDPDSIEIKPRGLIPVTDHDDLAPVQIQALPPEAYQEEQSLLGHMQQVTGISPYITGANMAGVDQNTATGVSVLNNAASRLLQFKAAQLQNGWQRTFEQWGDMIQQYMDKPEMVRIVGPGGETTFQQVTPDDVIGDYDYRIIGSEESLSKQQERSDAIALLNSLAPFAQLGILNMTPLIERVASAFGFPNPEALLAPPQQQPPAAPVPPGQNGQQAQMPTVNQGQPPGAQQNLMLNPQVMQMMAGQ